ncbi:MAG: hypothetical protein PHV11_04620 [Candidatus Bipolaricaulis sp.]|nr:hypothetical protein [Candidatus Bipolaricaulis sp.]
MKSDIKKQKIGGSYYNVQYVENLRDPEDNKKLDGRITETDHIIKIESSLDYQGKLQSLLHEDIHAICWQYKIEDVENFVVQMSSGIFALIVDNPEFIGKILKFASKQKGK